MIPEAAAEAAADIVRSALWGYITADEAARQILEAAAPHVLAPALTLAAEWDAVAEVFPRSPAGIFAKSHANRLREVLV